MRHGAALGFVLAAAPAAAASLSVEVRGPRGPAPDAVVFAVPDGRPLPPHGRRAVLDQKNRTFVPHILPIQVGTAVTFPNSDNVRHQVYSFSPAKIFQLPLYAGTPGAVIFDKPGVVALGCNIHDRMSAYIVVVDTPYFAATRNGRADLSNLPDGPYTVRIWYAGMRAEPPPQPTVLAAAEPKNVTFRIGNP